MNLCETKCVSCKEATKLSHKEIEEKRLLVPEWGYVSGVLAYIHRAVKVRNFSAAYNLVGEVALLAEREGHHPDLHIIHYNTVSFELHTYSAKGLSINDFILAAKIDKIIATHIL